MLIYLIGFMGCGKTTVGMRLAKILKYKFIDLDELIEERTGKKISEIFEEEGQQGFRQLETETLKYISSREKIVIATGGGTPCFNNNLTLMNESGITVYIRMAPGSLFHRLLPSKTKRPLIAGLTDLQLMEFIMNTLPERELFYSQAKFTVKGENLKAEKISELLIEI